MTAADGPGAVGAAGATHAMLVVAYRGGRLAARLATGWTRIAVRIVGSWIAALGLLALGWVLRR